MLNNVVLVGRLTRDPETRSTTSGMTVASFTIASDERRGGQKTTIFMPVSVLENRQTSSRSSPTRDL